MAGMENREVPDNNENEEREPDESEAHSRPELLRRVSSYYTPYLEDRLKRKLKFYFMGPHEKYRARKKCPWKLLLQILKIIIVTIQVIVLAMYMLDACKTWICVSISLDMLSVQQIFAFWVILVGQSDHITIYSLLFWSDTKKDTLR